MNEHFHTLTHSSVIGYLIKKKEINYLIEREKNKYLCGPIVNVKTEPTLIGINTLLTWTKQMV